MKFLNGAFLSCFLLVGVLVIAQDPLHLNYDTLQSRIYLNQIEYNTISLRARLHWDDGNVEQEFMASIRCKKDSVIWLSIGMYGIEGMRVLLTKDTLSLISKVTNEYAIRPFNSLQRWILFPVTFNVLQQIIEGSRTEILSQAMIFTVEDSTCVLHEETDVMKQTLWVDTANYTLRKILLKDKVFDQDMTITFGRYNFQEGKPFSFQRDILIHREKSTASLKMDILKMVVNGDIDFPFEISEKYKKTE